MKALLAALAAGAVALGAGCSAKEEEPDLVNGKILFKQKCQSCHDLARADSQGNTIGPSLDAAFANSKREGQGESTIQGVVDDQIKNPLGPQMPANLVEGGDARDVAAYVAYAAARAGEDTGQLAQAGRPEDREEPVAATGTTLTLDADPTGATAFIVPGKPDEGRVRAATAKPGRLELVMPNPSTTDHNIAIRGDSLQPALGNVVNKGGTSRISATVKAGEYTFFCSVGSHEQSGMGGKLTVK